MSDGEYVAARDIEWATVGAHLDLGTELAAEWGVQFERPTGHHVSLYGDGENDEAEAREFAGNFTPRGEQTAKVVRRRVLYGPWEEA